MKILYFTFLGIFCTECIAQGQEENIFLQLDNRVIKSWESHQVLLPNNPASLCTDSLTRFTFNISNSHFMKVLTQVSLHHFNSKRKIKYGVSYDYFQVPDYKIQQVKFRFAQKIHPLLDLGIANNWSIRKIALSTNSIGLGWGIGANYRLNHKLHLGTLIINPLSLKNELNLGLKYHGLSWFALLEFRNSNEAQQEINIVFTGSYADVLHYRIGANNKQELLTGITISTSKLVLDLSYLWQANFGSSLNCSICYEL